MEKFDSFAAAHDLTRRERELLLGMIRGASLEDLAGTFGIAISTVRYHQTGLLKKTDMPSRSNLLRHFLAFRAAVKDNAAYSSLTCLNKS
jgi:DNA-binding CsgD family transcriptional regulator